MAKTKALISFAVTAKLICVLVFAYAKSLFSHDVAHLKAVKIDNFHMVKCDIFLIFAQNQDCGVPTIYFVEQKQEKMNIQVNPSFTN